MAWSGCRCSPWWRRPAPRSAPEHRAAGVGFLLLLALLAFFAIVMDLVHLAFINSFYASQLVLEVAEEGGEMLTQSLALMLALTLARRSPASRLPTWPWQTEAVPR